MNIEYTIYKTSDIYFSAYLVALDFKMLNTEEEIDETTNRKKLFFVFELPKMQQTLIKSGYFNGSGTIKALRYAQALKSLKSMCYV